ncbi:hypothetical protein AGR1B_pa0129 [Agrobacterium fabacearum S56]|nr:hypothetical protein AGR1B_pa0129 [Agrobacterium fabacearum S56]
MGGRRGGVMAVAINNHGVVVLQHFQSAASVGFGSVNDQRRAPGAVRLGERFSSLVVKALYAFGRR